MFTKEEIEYIEDMTTFYLEDDFDYSAEAKSSQKVYQSILEKCKRELNK